MIRDLDGHAGTGYWSTAWSNTKSAVSRAWGHVKSFAIRSWGHVRSAAGRIWSGIKNHIVKPVHHIVKAAFGGGSGDRSGGGGVPSNYNNDAVSGNNGIDINSTFASNDNMLPAWMVKGHEIVEKAKSWIGVPYDPKGTSREGTDCSHLVWNVYKESGLEYSYKSTREFKSLTVNFEKVDRPYEGDVALYKGHMGIYTQGKVISAQSGAKKVTLGELNWFDNLIGYYRYK